MNGEEDNSTVGLNYESIPKDIRYWIDHASYEDLLRKWRFEPAGSPYFHGDTGRYFAQVMKRKKDEVGQEVHVRISKRIGWGD